MVRARRTIKDGTGQEEALEPSMAIYNHIRREIMRMTTAILRQYETSEGLLLRVVCHHRRVIELPGLQKQMDYHQDRHHRAMLLGQAKGTEGLFRVMMGEEECPRVIEVGRLKWIHTFRATLIVMTDVEAVMKDRKGKRGTTEVDKELTEEIKSIETLDGGEAEAQREIETGTGSFIGGKGLVHSRSCLGFTCDGTRDPEKLSRYQECWGCYGFGFS